MLGLYATALSVILAGPVPSPGPLSLTPPARGSTSPEREADAPDPIEAAQRAWGADPPDYVRVRQLLEPIAEFEPLDDPLRREKVLLLLADATVLDGTIMPIERRRDMAARHLDRLLDADSDFQFPSGLYSQQLDALWIDVREERSARKAQDCEAERMSCEADLQESRADLEALRQRYDELEAKYQDQEVAQVEVQTRNRALAIFPLGISHFYNGKPGWGAGFLAAEAAFGIAGLTLLIYRTTVDGCTRRRGFRAGSLSCSPRGGDTSERAMVARRQAEEAMAWAFLGTAVLDIVLAQVLFEEFTVVDQGFKPRRQLERDLEGKAEEAEPRNRRRRRRDRRAAVRATVRPTPAVLDRGAGMGVRFRF
jgi:hypothetical protein